MGRKRKGEGKGNRKEHKNKYSSKSKADKVRAEMEARVDFSEGLIPRNAPSQVAYNEIRGGVVASRRFRAIRDIMSGEIWIQAKQGVATYVLSQRYIVADNRRYNFVCDERVEPVREEIQEIEGLLAHCVEKWANSFNGRNGKSRGF